MPFERGQVSFARFTTAVTGALVGEEDLDRLAEHAFRETEIGEPPEIETGWVAGRHVYDTTFDHAQCVYDGGGVAHFALRLDTNRVPAEIRRAIRAQHEAALIAESPDGRLSRGSKKELREVVDAALRAELADGKHRRSKMIPLLWQPRRRCLLSVSGANNVAEALRERWRLTFEHHLEACSAGRLAYELLSARGESRAFEDLTPSAFTAHPSNYVPRADEEGGPWERSSTTPPVVWALKSPEPRDFIGNEFLLWLWERSETSRGEVALKDGGDGAAAVHIVFDGAIEMACPWGATGSMTLKAEVGESAPSRSAEATEGLATGKWPRRVGMTLAEGEDVWRLSLQGDRWLISGCALPETDEEFETPRDEAEWRFERILRLDDILLRTFDAFLDERVSPAWPSRRERITAWIAGRRKSRQAPHVSHAAAFVEPKPNPEEVGAA